MRKSYFTKPESSYYLILGSVAALTGLGLTMVLSASAVRALHESGNSFAIVGKQLFFLALSVPAAYAAMKLKPSLWGRLSNLALLLSFGFLLLPFIPGLGKTVNGNTNWITFAGFTLQPSEFAKFGLIIWCAAKLSTYDKNFRADGSDSTQHSIKFFWYLMPGFIAMELLILKGHDVGTAVIMAMIFAGILFIAGLPYRLMAISSGAALAVLAALVVSSSNRRSRFAALLNPFAEQYYKGAGWQPAHSLMGLASGGLLGIGIGASKQKWGGLAEAHTDFIFSVIGEELGLIGTLIVVVLFALLLISIFKIALGAPTAFERYATAGIGCWISMQVAVNMGSVLSLIPVAGVTLPLVSYGGSSLLSVYIAMGFVLGVARRTESIRIALLDRRKNDRRKNDRRKIGSR